MTTHCRPHWHANYPQWQTKVCASAQAKCVQQQVSGWRNLLAVTLLTVWHEGFLGGGGRPGHLPDLVAAVVVGAGEVGAVPVPAERLDLVADEGWLQHHLRLVPDDHQAAVVANQKLKTKTKKRNSDLTHSALDHIKMHSDTIISWSGFLKILNYGPKERRNKILQKMSNHLSVKGIV